VPKELAQQLLDIEVTASDASPRLITNLYRVAAYGPWQFFCAPYGAEVNLTQAFIVRCKSCYLCVYYANFSLVRLQDAFTSSPAFSTLRQPWERRVNRAIWQTLLKWAILGPIDILSDVQQLSTCILKLCREQEDREIGTTTASIDHRPVEQNPRPRRPMVSSIDSNYYLSHRPPF